MRKLLFLLPNLHYSGCASDVALLARQLPREQYEIRICLLQDAGPLGDSLRVEGITVEELRWQRLLDWRALQRLRRAAADADVIHVWKPAALRALWLAGRPTRARLLFSPTPVERPFFDVVERFDLWITKMVDRIVDLPPEVGPLRPSSIGREELLGQIGLPATARYVLCIGPLERHKGYKDAIWAFDIVRFLYDDLHLVLIGDGSDRQRLEEFQRNIGATSYVHFAGEQNEVIPYLQYADIVWIPSPTRGGVHVALEAMALNQPVVASRSGQLSRIIKDGQTGFLFPPGDKVALARQTRLLLDHPEDARRLGESAGASVQEHWNAAEFLRRATSLYE